MTGNYLPHDLLMHQLYRLQNSRKSDVDEFDIVRLKLNYINAIHTGGSEARKADSDVAKGLECQFCWQGY